MTRKEQVIRFRSFWIFPGLAALLLYSTRRWQPATQLGDLLWLLPLGILVWTILEYGLHRFVFHGDIKTTALRRLVDGTHAEHHKAPRDPRQLLVHTTYALVISAIVYVIILAILRDWFRASGVMAGVWAGFLYYESVHYRVHLTTGNRGIIVWQRRAHFHHHFRDPERCFGVTTPLWDYVFGTSRNLPAAPQ